MTYKMPAKPVINLTSNIYLAFDQLDKEWNQRVCLGEISFITM